jgi:hypothetical protein
MSSGKALLGIGVKPSLAALRTPANPWDMRVSLCVEGVLG